MILYKKNITYYVLTIFLPAGKKMSNAFVLTFCVAQTVLFAGKFTLSERHPLWQRDVTKKSTHDITHLHDKNTYNHGLLDMRRSGHVVSFRSLLLRALLHLSLSLSLSRLARVHHSVEIFISPPRGK
jgi:hypothetical protein